MIKVSIIIPIYKVEPYLEECIQSVMNQTYTELEIILVDDGSPDMCPVICDEYAQKDSRIKVIHRKNGGLSASRNSGMAIATGEYIYFLDSDDKIFPQAIEVMVNRIKEHPSVDVVVASTVSQEKRPLHFYDLKKYPEYTDDRKWIHEKFCKWEISITAWNKLYRRAFLETNKLFFPEGLLHEDVLWSFYIQKNIKSVAFIDEYCYWYRLSNQNSITNKIDKTMSCLAHLQIIEMVEKDINDDFDVEFLMPISSYKFWSVYYPLSKNKRAIKDKCAEIYHNIRQRNNASEYLKRFTVISSPKWMISNWCFYTYRAFMKFIRIIKLNKI